jgi:hypothetical protein
LENTPEVPLFIVATAALDDFSHVDTVEAMAVAVGKAAANELVRSDARGFGSRASPLRDWSHNSFVPACDMRTDLTRVMCPAWLICATRSSMSEVN